MNYKITIGKNIYNIDIERMEPSLALYKSFSKDSLSENLPLEKETTRLNTDIKDNDVVAPMDGKILKLNFSNKDRVKIGDTILILEAMKMENEITANKSGTITYIVNVGDEVAASEKLAIIN